MKKNLILVTVLLFALLFASCVDPLTREFEKPQDKQTVRDIPAGKGAFYIRFDEVAMRAIMPDKGVLQFNRITLDFIDADTFGTSNKIVESLERTGSTLNAPVFLPPGDYVLEMTAYTSLSNVDPAAVGTSGSFNISAGTNTVEEVTFTVYINDGGRGRFSWDISIPQGLGSDLLEKTITIMYLDYSTMPIETLTFNTLGAADVSRGYIDLDSGFYRVLITLKIDNMHEAVIFRQFLQVYKNMDSVFKEVYTEEDFSPITTVSVAVGGSATPRRFFDLNAALNWINSPEVGAGTYTVMLYEDQVLTAARTLNIPDTNITLVGVGGEKAIRNATVYEIFRINALNAHLTLGNNITLRRPSGAGAVIVENGTLTMLDGSKITGYWTLSVRPGGVFNMEGGEINAIEIPISISSGGIVNISGGSISEGDEGIYLTDTVNFTISGNPTVGKITLDARNATEHAVINIGANFTGRVNELVLSGDVYDVATVISWWMNKPVLMGAGLNAEIVSRFTLGNFTTSSYIMPQPIANTHTIAAEGADIGKLVPIPAPVTVRVGNGIPVDRGNLAASLDWINGQVPGNYTVTLYSDQAIANRMLSPGVNVTLIGAGKERTITHNDTAIQRMFIINNNNSLTLENNITLKGNASGSSELVRIADNGSFTMENGSKITEHGSNAVGLYFGEVASGTFTMNGGEISRNNDQAVIVMDGKFIMNDGLIHENNVSSNMAISAGGVYIQGAQFEMNGGKVINNTRQGIIDADVVVRNSSTQLILSGNAEIGAITLPMSSNPLNVSASIFITANWNGVISMIDLADFMNSNDINAVIGAWSASWSNRQILAGLNGYSITSTDVAKIKALRNFATNGYHVTRLISPEYYINNSGVLTFNESYATVVVNDTDHYLSLEVAFATIRTTTTGTFDIKLLANQDLAARIISANQNVTIVGDGQMRTITHTGTANQTMFTISGENASLTLGNNVTLKGNSERVSSANLVNILNGELKMLSGSMITGHIINSEGAVYVNGENARLDMQGGEITGSTRNNLTTPADVSVRANVATGNITLSGVSKIGGITLNTSSSTVHPNILVASNFTGSVLALNLQSTMLNWWTDKQILAGAAGHTLTAENVLSFTLGNYIYVSGEISSLLADTYVLSTVAPNIGRLMILPPLGTSEANPFLVTQDTFQYVGRGNSNPTEYSAWIDEAYYKLTQKITLTGEWTPIPPFDGMLDGNGFVIDGLTITSPSITTDRQGLFASLITNGVVKNVGLVNVNIDVNANNVGGIAGQMGNNTRIENCYVSGTIKGNESVGGIAGQISGTNAIIQNCYVVGSIESTGETSAGNNAIGMVGGIVGSMNSNLPTPIIQNCVSLASRITVINHLRIGRIAGLGGAFRSNYSINSIVTNGGVQKTITSSLTGIDGFNMSIDEAKSVSFWTNASNWNAASLWNPDIWIFTEGRLPSLKNTPDLPELPAYLQ